ncbi:MAG: DnaJ domain-containing protein [Phycisphaerales bacterium]|nr:DnaJ domain-containing protein [Phycisphaerae bacterium]NNF45102.1 DnaJ domain-containing protein [Phycisphaerales bacterium]NNM25144.1 DnaJ domain-containing protein [Phycisphaerales bacterium]
MAKSTDYYEALGITRSASAEEIRAAYRKLARQYHPDVNKSPDAATRFSEITEAYEVLSDPEKRKTYDHFGRVGAGSRGGSAADAGGSPWAGGDWPSGGAHGHVDIGSIFDEMFGGGVSGGRGAGGPGGPGGAGPFGARPQTQPRRGRDVEHPLSISFMTAVRGGEERLRMSRNDKEETVRVKIPSGIESGARLRVKGRGDPAPAGGQRGDLILLVDVGRHPVFTRDGLDLLVNVPISITEAALGTSVEVPLLAGTATVKVPEGANSGTKLRIRGQGITDAKGTSGDLFAVVQIVTPTRLSERARGLLEELSGELQNPRDTGGWADTENRVG